MSKPSRPVAWRCPFHRQSACPRLSCLPAAAILLPWLAVAAAPALAAAPATANVPDDSVQEIVITAARAPAVEYLATDVGTVDHDTLLREGGSSLADALRNMPGVTSSGFAAGASRPVLRGFDAARVRMLEDGVGSFDVSDLGPDHGVPIDPLAAQKIEVLRGPATLRYVGEAVGGIVNTVNNRVPGSLPAQPLSGELFGAWASGARAGEGAGHVDGRLGQVALHADAFGRHAGDWGIPAGTQANSFFTGNGESVGAAWVDGESHAGAALVHFASQYGIPGDVSRIEMSQTKALAHASLDLDAGVLQTLTLDAGHAGYVHREVMPDTGAVASTFRDRETEARVEGLLDAFGPFASAALGLQAQQRAFEALGAGQDYLLPADQHALALFGYTEMPLAKGWRLQGGLRYERLRVTGTPASGLATTRDFAPLSGSLGLVYEPHAGIKVTAALTSGARAPGLPELYARGPHDGPGTFETGDATLPAERADSGELNVHLEGDDTVLEASLWGARFKGFLYGALTGRSCDEAGLCGIGPGPLRELDYRAQDAHFAGLELNLARTLHEGGAGRFELRLFGDTVDARLADGNPVPRMPPWHGGMGLAWHRAALGAGFDARYSAPVTRLAAGETPTAGYTSVDAWASWELPLQRPGITLGLAAHNLGDSVQHNAMALNKDVVTLPGRDIRLSLRAEL
jgi:iron complex outermembrane recepter protein